MEASSVLPSVTLNVIAALQLAVHHVTERDPLPDKAEFDYIVIGGGTAGCVLANRLSEDPNIKVALLEAGAQQPSESVLPALYSLIPGSNYDYNFKTEQDYYTGQMLQDQVPRITNGKMLSGSSGLDPLYQIRSVRKDFQRWVDITEDESWGFDEILKYYIKSERLEDQEILDSAEAYLHGTKGPIGNSRQTSVVNEGIISAFKEIGVDFIQDINGESPKGVSEPLLRISEGSRQSTAESYLLPIQERENLFIYTLTTATRVLFDEYSKAVGVEAVNYNNETVAITATKEVLISAGVMKSAQLLMLSGVGPSEHIESWGVDTVADLEVGRYLRDQVGAVLAYKLKPLEANEEILDPSKFPVPVTVAYKSLDPKDDYPNYRVDNLYFPKKSSFLRPICTNEFKYIDAVCDRYVDANLENDLLFSIVYNLDPFSTGSVALQSSDPFADPWIYMGTFTYSQDVDYLGYYLQDFSAIASTKSFQELEAELVEVELEYCDYLDRDSSEYWRCYGRSMSTLLGHTSGSCPMGPVLNNKLQVHGVSKLRVVDPASMPMLNSGQLTVDVVALAEKAADLIKADQ